MTITGGFSRHRLRGHRDGCGLSREALAARAGCSPAAVKSYENAVTQPSPRMLAALARALGVAADDLCQQNVDPTRDYIGAVTSHARPLTAAELEGAALVLRTIRRRTHAQTDDQAMTG